MIARLRRRLRRDQHDEGGERGMALVMVLVAIVIIATLFTAVLNYQSTALKAQTILSDKRARDAAGDAGIDSAIVQAQKSTAIGVSTGTACTTTSPVTLLTWNDPIAGNVVVTCKMQSSSSGSGSTRSIELAASIGGVNLSTAQVTLYDPPSGSGASVVSVTNWDRVATT